jgi:YD repeat-containing protein
MGMGVRLGTGYAYDNNGNLLTKVVESNTTSFTWDFENRLTSVTLPGSSGTISFAYDPFGRPIKKVTPSVTSVFAYDGDNLVEETNASGTAVVRYSQGLNIDEPAATLVLLKSIGRKMGYFVQAIQELRSVPIPDYEERVEDICRDLQDETDEIGDWPAEFFPGVLALLQDPQFVSVRTSWHLLQFLKKNWNLISEEEASALKGAVVDAYDKFGDWTGAFIASEVLGELYPDRDTLAILTRLSKTARDPWRELVPHGMEKLARTTQDHTLRAAAIEELRLLLQDKSEALRREASGSLSLLRLDPALPLGPEKEGEEH